MTIFGTLRTRLAGSDAPDADPDANGDGDPPIEGYDRLDDRQVMKRLADHSQVELKAIEGYERSHEERQTVLDKLRYMRGREPLPGYDALDPKEIVTELESADLPAIRRIRGYERKFANRPDVLEAVTSAHHARLASEPDAEVPGYQPLSAKK